MRNPIHGSKPAPKKPKPQPHYIPANVARAQQKAKQQAEQAAANVRARARAQERQRIAEAARAKARAQAEAARAQAQARARAQRQEELQRQARLRAHNRPPAPAQPKPKPQQKPKAPPIPTLGLPLAPKPKPRPQAGQPQPKTPPVPTLTPPLVKTPQQMAQDALQHAKAAVGPVADHAKARADAMKAGLNPNDFGKPSPPPQPKKQPLPTLFPTLIAPDKQPVRFKGTSDQRLKSLDHALPANPGQKVAALLVRKNYERAVRDNKLGRTTVEDLVNLLFDPHHAMFDPSNPTHVKIVQTFLRQQGKKVTVDGVYGAQTHTALVSAFADAHRREVNQQRVKVASSFYSTGMLHAGARAPSWLYLPAGMKTPTPGELTHYLQSGTFSAAMTWQSILRHAKDPSVQFLQWRQEQLGRLDRLFTPPGMGGVVPHSHAQKIVNVAMSPAMDTPSGRAQIEALYKSRTANEFVRNLKVIAAREEKAYRESLQKQAHHLSWWQTGLHWVAKPGEWLRTEVVAGALAFGDLFSSAATGGSPLLFGGYGPGGLRLSGEASWREQEIRAAEAIARLPGPYRFAFEVVVDPLNLLGAGEVGAVARVGGKVVTGITRAGGHVLVDVAAHGSIADSVGASIIRHAGEGLLKTADRSFYLPAAKEAALGAFATHPVTGRIYRLGVLATRTKNDALQVAKTKVLGAASHGFIEPAKRVTGKVVQPASHAAEHGHAAPPVTHDPVAAYGEHVVKNPETKAALADTHARLQEQLPTVMPELIAALRDSKASIWSNAARHGGEFSSVGASVRARAISQARHVEVLKLARESGWEAWNAVASKVDGVVFDESGRVASFPRTAEAAAARDEADAAFRAEYERVKKAVGTYRHGSGDSELLALLDRRVNAFAEKFDRAVLPAIQDSLERFAFLSGEHLFAADGSWLHALGAGQNALRRAAAEAIDNTVLLDNPLYGKLVSFAEAERHINSELDRRIGRLRQYFAREVERGNPKHLTRKWLDDETAKIEAEVRKAWQPVQQEDGSWLYTDVRPKIEESVLYAGHLDAVANVSADTALKGLGDWEKALTELALPAGESATSGIDNELGQLVWHLTSDHPEAPFGITQADSAARQGVGRFPAEGEKAKRAWADFKATAAERTVWLAEAYAEVISKALWNEGAAWRALVHTQNRPLKWLYTGLNAHLSMWRFLVLPANIGWLFRNTLDNTAKILVQGARDPRLYFPPENVIGKAAVGVFEQNIRAQKALARFVDGLVGTDTAGHFEQIVDTFWQNSSETISRIFRVHGIEVPEHVIDNGKKYIGAAFDGPNELRILNQDIEHLKRMGVSDRVLELAAKHRRLSDAELAAERSHWTKARDWVWDVMGNRPEDRARRILYRDTYYKVRKAELKAGATVMEAERKAYYAAAAKVEKTLFDYSKISVIEDNLKIFFPFLQFWRKNTVFWLTTAAEKPWLPLSVYKFEHDREQSHADWAHGLTRYVLVNELTDVTARVPGLEWLLKATGADQLAYDPVNFFSFAPLWKMFADANPTLPNEKKGWAFLAPMLESIEATGLGMNPLFSLPLQSAGILNQQAWRTVFPQTNLAVALTRKFVGDHFAGTLIDIDAMFADPIFTVLSLTGHGTTPSQRVQENFDYWVQVEMTNQLARGEKADRAKAVKKIQDYFLVQAVVATFTGSYVRRATPEDWTLAKLADTVHEGLYSTLTDREKELYAAWKLRGADRATYDRYVDTIPLLRTYHGLPSYDAKEQFKQEHPEILPYVEPAYKGNPFPLGFAQTAQLVLDTQTAMQLTKLASALHLDHQMQELARQTLVTPELEAFWAANDTPAEKQRKHLQGQYYNWVQKLNDGYWAIPEHDYAARATYLRQHPDLVTFWNANNSDSDDFKAIINHVLADYRQRYFEYVDKGDWHGATKFLDAHPWVFDNISDGRYVMDRHTGRPSGHGGGVPKSQHARDYLAAKAALDHYFSLSPAQRSAFLHSGSAQAQTVLNYFEKYGHHGGHALSAKARDYLAAKSALDRYFSLPKDKRSAWLRGGSADAKAVLAYFEKHAHQRPTSQKAKDYLKAKKALDHYFALPKAKRSAWLRSHDPLAKQALAYFTKHAHQHPLTQKAKDYLAAKHGLDHYFSLPKAKRAAWLAGNSKDAKAVRRYFERHAKKPALSSKAHAYLAAKAGIDYYFTLPADQRAAWLNSADPRAVKARQYFQRYGSPSGKPKSQHAKDYLAAQDALTKYWQMPADERAAWLASGSPEAQIVKHYFDTYSNQGGQTQHALDYGAAKPALDYYFSLPKGERAAFLASADERAAQVRDYFKKYSKTAQIEKSVSAAEQDLVNSQDAALRDRLDFWRTYFSLTPDKRPLYVQQEAEAHGVFIYGYLGRTEQAAKQNDWYAQASLAGLTEKAAAYLYAKPLLDFYFTITDAAERALFLRANPELANYLDNFAHDTLTGDPYIDGLIEDYFKLPASSDLRSAYLRLHPEVQDFFDSKTDPETAAIRRLVNVYFSTPPKLRRDFLIRHPEVSLYFDARKRYKNKARAQAEVFTFADPRLKPYLDAAAFSVGGSGKRMRERLAFTREHRDKALSRRGQRLEGRTPIGNGRLSQ